MVFLTQVLCVSKKYVRKFQKQGIVDSLRLYVRAGIGGAGLPKYGGKGGDGGNVYVVSDEKMTLNQLSKQLADKKVFAEPGSASSAKGIIGMPGEDVIVKVPVGICVFTDAGVKLGELNKEGDQVLVAKGGIGGCQETGFCGTKGEARGIKLDLRLIADVGLIGFPNAGKSTLLHAISRAKTKIANYPFTTLKPHLGILRYDDLREISVADLPGLIEGAHMNLGMGHKFLKHVERTKVLLFVSDVQGFQLSVKHHKRSCLETILLLNKEIEMYNPDLLEMPAMLLINKMDTEGAAEIYREIEPKLRNLEEHVKEVEEESRPQRTLQFAEIMTASLISGDKQEAKRIRNMIREVIDRFAINAGLSEDFEEAEARLREKLERLHQPNAPTLV